MGRHRQKTHNAVKIARFSVAAGLLVVSWIVVQNKVTDAVPAEVAMDMALPTAIPEAMVLPSAQPAELVIPPSRRSTGEKDSPPPSTPPSTLPPAPTTVVERPPARKAPEPKPSATPKPSPPPTPKPMVRAVPPKPAAPMIATPKLSGHAGLISIAKSYIGVGIRYVYGGKTPPTLDCSGFVWTVLKRAGYSVPYRSSSALKAWATPISSSQAQPGDLVFWPGHVGFYAGPGLVVDNGTSAGPKVTAIWGSPTYGRIPL